MPGWLWRSIIAASMAIVLVATTQWASLIANSTIFAQNLVTAIAIALG